MAFIVETGAGVPSANAYATVAFVSSYLAERARSAENSWQSQASTRQQQAIVTATSYIDNRWGPRIGGTRLRDILPGREATGRVTFGTLPANASTITVGLIVYRFVDTLAVENDVMRGSTVAEAAANLAAAITDGGNGVVSHIDTVGNYEVSAVSEAGVVTITADAQGTSGNGIALSTAISGATVVAFAGGLDEGPQGLIFPRRGLIGFDGRAVVGIPFKLKAATAEYAVRSLAAQLDPDLTVDARGALVQRKREKVGPIEEETEYAPGATPRIYQDYPAADRLLVEYLARSGGVVR